MSIQERYRAVRAAVPDDVTIVLAAKTRSAAEVAAAIDAGATDIGHNYVQEAVAMRAALGATGDRVRWHMIGHLQSNKIGKALGVFDVLQTVDSLERARAVDRKAAAAGRAAVPVLLEINIAGEASKAGIRASAGTPLEDVVLPIVGEVARLEHVRVVGLMTMGPAAGDPEAARPWFRRAREILDRVAAADIPGVEPGMLSMGMTNSYQIAIEEGSTMIRIGTAVFGARAR